MRPVSTEKKIVEKSIFFLNLVFESWYETVVLVFFYNISPDAQFCSPHCSLPTKDALGIMDKRV